MSEKKVPDCGDGRMETEGSHPVCVQVCLITWRRIAMMKPDGNIDY